MSETPSRDPSRDNAMSVAAISSERIESDDNVWTRRLVLFLRIMAVVSVIKGLYHWAQVTGFIGGEDDAFENQSMAWQTATVYFAVIELVAAVGLWLATPWGAVVWLTTVVSMAVIELMFPGHLRRQPARGGGGSLDARRLSRARLDGRARTAAISRESMGAFFGDRINAAACGHARYRVYKIFREIFAVTFQSLYRRHIRYADVSNSDGAVSICDNPRRRSVNASALTVNERLRKVLIRRA